MATQHHDVTEHTHGTMDTSQQRATFAGFIRMCTGVVIAAAVVLIFLALVGA